MPPYNYYTASMSLYHDDISFEYDYGITFDSPFEEGRFSGGTEHQVYTYELTHEDIISAWGNNSRTTGFMGLFYKNGFYPKDIDEEGSTAEEVSKQKEDWIEFLTKLSKYHKRDIYYSFADRQYPTESYNYNVFDLDDWLFAEFTTIWKYWFLDEDAVDKVKTYSLLDALFEKVEKDEDDEWKYGGKVDWDKLREGL